MKIIFGLPLTPDELELFQRCTGRREPAAFGYLDACLIIGRRGGKSLILALIAAYLACFHDWSPYLTPGERGTIMIVAADRRQARTIFRYLRGMLSIPLLTGMIERETADAIDLSNSTTIEIQTASFRTVRGYTIVAALADELAFWRSDESANPGLVFEPDLSGGRQERAGGDRSLGGWINPHIGCGHKTKGDTMLDTVTTPRTELRAAIARRDAAAQGEIDATKAAVRAKQLLDDAEQNVAMLSGVDDKIAKHRADEIKAWATNGGQRPSGALPSHLASKKAFKADAEAKFTAARSAHEVLSNELVAAPGHLQRQQVAVQRAAGAVLSAEAPSLIEELHQARRTVWALEYKLKSLSAVRFTEVDGRSVLIQMPAATFAALNETAPPMLAINAPKPYTIALAGWQRYLQALSDNPDSTLE